MPDKVVDGSNAAASGGENQNQQSNVSTDKEMPAWAAEFKADMQKQVAEALGQARAAQGGKDELAAGQQKLAQQVADQKGEFAKVAGYLEQYQDPLDAERNYKMDAFLQRMDTGGQEPDPFAQQNTNLAGVNSDASTVNPEVLKQYGIDPQSAEYLDQVAAGRSGIEAALAIVNARNPGQTNSATGASGGTGGGGVDTAQQVLKDQYDAALDDAQKRNGGVLSPLDSYRIQEDFVKKGLEGIW